eukprot:TRINITY_DN96162_c0_g1_i1.p1 TRINITY_DN96162_c0_g1~~TRINITY_DN96162_c0_g1_i1.p1  ORF type:complete len:381 (-),score=37.90 TRINITY_DN96162_c0_g1_i1:14-1117(-)
MATGSPRDSWSAVLSWTCSFCLRGDGTPLGTRFLDLVSRMLFYSAGMTTGDPADFRRATWDTITSTQEVRPSDNESGISCYDAFVPSFFDADPVQIPCRFYRPALPSQNDEELPTLVYFHGGGFCIQSEKQKSAHDMVIQLCRRLGCRAVSVGYRLAPECPFPCGLRDAYSVLRWLLVNGEKTSFILAGDSAGANLALVCGLLALNGVDANLKPAPDCNLLERIRHLLLIYPYLLAKAPSEKTSSQMYYMLPRATTEFFQRSYMGSGSETLKLMNDWRVSPLRAPSFAGLPASTVLSCTLDPLCDECVLLAKELQDAKVPVRHLHVSEAPHGFLTFPWFATDVAKVAKAMDDIEVSVRASLQAKPLT